MVAMYHVWWYMVISLSLSHICSKWFFIVVPFSANGFFPPSCKKGQTSSKKPLKMAAVAKIHPTPTQISDCWWVKPFEFMTFQSGKAKVKWTPKKSFWEFRASQKFRDYFWEMPLRCRGVEALESKQVWKAALGVDGKLLTVVQKVDLSLFKWKYSCSTSLSL